MSRITGLLLSSLLLGMFLTAQPAAAYWSSYETVEWDSRPGDSFYCLDIFDQDWRPVRQAVACGEGLHRYSPRDLELAPGVYRWKTWSPSVSGTFANSLPEPGFSGEFTVPAYYSSPARLIWGQRGSDTLYCVDIFNDGWQVVSQAAACGENLHTYAPAKSNLPPGTYRWAAWSPSAKGTDDLPWHHSAGEALSGWFTVQENASSATLLDWGRRGNDSRYCLDISDSQGNMLHQAVACGEGLLSYSPQDLNLAGGDYRWKVWSPSVMHTFHQPQPGFEGEFHVDTCGLPYRSDNRALQWGCREKDLLYCVDIFDSKGQVIAAPWLCDEQLHSFYPEWLKDRNLPAGDYRWKVWSPSVQNYAGAQPGFEGVFSYTPPQPVARPGGEEDWEFYGDRSSIRALLPTSDGKLWLGTSSSYQDGGGLELRRQSDGGLEQLVLEGDGALPTGVVTALYRDAAGLWVATSKGLARQRPDGGWETLTTANSALPDNIVSALAGDGAGGLWMTGSGLIHKRADGVWERIDSSASGLRDRGGSSDTQMQVLAGDGRGGVWVGAVASYCTSTMRECYQSDGDSGGGLAHYDGQGNWRQFTAQETGLPHTSVTALAEDGHGGMWVGLGINARDSMHQPVIAHYNGRVWRQISVPIDPASFNNSVAALAGDGGYGVWMSNQQGKLYHYDGNGWRQLQRDATADMAFLLERVPHLYPQYPASLKLLSALSENFYARDAIPDGRGGFWAISEADGGMFVDATWQQPAFQLSHIGPQGLWQASGDKFPYRNGWRKPVDDRAGGVWVAGERSLLHYNALGQRIEELVPPYPLDTAYSIIALAIDAQGGVWLGNGNGELLHYDGRAWQTIALVPPQPLGFGTPPGSAILSIAPDAGGVWVGLVGKLAWYDGVQARLFDLNELLSLEVPEQTWVNTLLPDGQGGVWLSTYDRAGLAHFDGQSTWRHWAQGGSPIRSDPDGSLWIGGNGGMGAHLQFR